MVCGDFQLFEYFNETPIYCGFEAKHIEGAMLKLINTDKNFENEKNVQWSAKNVSKVY